MQHTFPYTKSNNTCSLLIPFVKEVELAFISWIVDEVLWLRLLLLLLRTDRGEILQRNTLTTSSPSPHHNGKPVLHVHKYYSNGHEADVNKMLCHVGKEWMEENGSTNISLWILYNLYPFLVTTPIHFSTVLLAYLVNGNIFLHTQRWKAKTNNKPELVCCNLLLVKTRHNPLYRNTSSDKM